VNHNDDGPVEVCVNLDGACSSEDDLVVEARAASDVAFVHIHGDDCVFPQILKAYDAVA